VSQRSAARRARLDEHGGVETLANQGYFTHTPRQAKKRICKGKRFGCVNAL
jgi:hypothetical protein